jgi:hypothetical protein
MAWFFLVGLSFATGLLRLPWWTVLVWPAVSFGLGAYLVADEPPNYDMPGFGYYVGGSVAVVCVAAWLLGRGLAALARGRGNTADSLLAGAFKCHAPAAPTSSAAAPLTAFARRRRSRHRHMAAARRLAP